MAVSKTADKGSIPFRFAKKLDIGKLGTGWKRVKSPINRRSPSIRIITTQVAPVTDARMLPLNICPVLDGFEGRSYKPLHKVQLLGGIPIGWLTSHWGAPIANGKQKKWVWSTDALGWDAHSHIGGGNSYWFIAEIPPLLTERRRHEID